MKCKIHVFQLNEHFSPEHAEAHYGGEDSENNRRYDWEDEFDITSDVQKVEEIFHATYPLMGQLPDGTKFHHDVKNMFLFEIQSSDAPLTYIGASMSLVDSHIIERNDQGYILKLYLKDYEPMSDPIPGIYIASKEFPKALIF